MLHQALEGVKSGLGSPEMLALNTIVLDGQQLRLSQLVDACGAVPFLSPTRLVIVKGLLGRFEPKSGSGRRSSRSETNLDSELREWRHLAEYIPQMPPTTVLVLVDGEVKANNRLLKSLMPLAKVMTFPQLRAEALRRWIEARVKQGGGAVSPAAVKLLVELVGADLWVMSNEVDKLLAFSSGRTITEDSVRKVSSYVREANIFVLVDAILEGRRKLAQKLLHQLLQQGAEPAEVLVMISRQLRWIVVAKERGKGILQSESREGLGPAHDFVLEKAIKQAKTYTLERVKSAYHKLLDADVAIKTGKYDGDLALDLLIVELCQG